MMVLKGLPSTYNKDLQGDKESMFSTFDKLNMVLEVAIGTVETLKINKENCRAALSYDMLATDVAYYLVRKGVPFRTAHHSAGQVVSLAEERGLEMSELELNELKTIRYCKIKLFASQITQDRSKSVLKKLDFVSNSIPWKSE